MSVLMKTKMLLHFRRKLFGALLPLCLFTWPCAYGSETNEAPSLTNGYATRFLSFSANDFTDGERAYYRNRLILGEKIEESLPSALDPDGNWGSATNGMQLSTRFRRAEFLKGEPVVALIILRNDSPKKRQINFERDVRANFKFRLKQGDKSLVWERPADVQIDTSHEINALPLVIGAHSQVAVCVRIDELFDLTRPGNYSLEISWSEYLRAPGNRPADVTSGSCKFSIVPEISPSQASETNKLFQYQSKLRKKVEDLVRAR